MLCTACRILWVALRVVTFPRGSADYDMGDTSSLLMSTHQVVTKEVAWRDGRTARSFTGSQEQSMALRQNRCSHECVHARIAP